MRVGRVTGEQSGKVCGTVMAGESEGGGGGPERKWEREAGRG